MKSIILFIIGVSCLHLVLSAQIPEGYYDIANGQLGEELKTVLNSIISGHKEFPYTSSSTDVWDILKESDRDTTNPDNVILFYTGWSVDAAQEYNNGSGWNREHVWAKSRGDFGTSIGPGTDAHHLRPTDISVNSARNNRWFDYCDEPYYDSGVETGCYTSSTSWVWQPRDEVRGDVARMIFYMATRYQGEPGEPDLEVIDYLPSDNYTNDPVHTKLSALLEWHEDDPVNDFERNRNEVVFSFQNNRNPFIDHPEYVDLIWAYAPTDIFPQENIYTFKVYPNPTAGLLTVESMQSGLHSIEITTSSGMLIFNSKLEGTTHQIDLSPFEKGVYFITIRSKGFEATKKIIKF